MAWDVEGTKRKILEAAVAEFAQFGPDAATVERIAKSAGVNKERIYNYFGDKRNLFAAVLRSELAKVALAAQSPVDEDIGDYAGRAFDYHCEHPELRSLSPEQRAAEYERVAAMSLYGIAAYTAFEQEGDRSAKAELQAAAQESMQRVGWDLAALDITHRGFEPRR